MKIRVREKKRERLFEVESKKTGKKYYAPEKYARKLEKQRKYNIKGIKNE